MISCWQLSFWLLEIVIGDSQIALKSCSKVMTDFCDVVDIALINFGRSSVNNNVSDLSSPSSHSGKVIDPFLVSVFILYPLKMGSQKT